jgi:hypothetical protein
MSISGYGQRRSLLGSGYGGHDAGLARRLATFGRESLIARAAEMSIATLTRSDTVSA